MNRRPLCFLTALANAAGPSDIKISRKPVRGEEAGTGRCEACENRIKSVRTKQNKKENILYCSEEFIRKESAAVVN